MQHEASPAILIFSLRCGSFRVETETLQYRISLKIYVSTYALTTYPLWPPLCAARCTYEHFRKKKRRKFLFDNVAPSSPAIRFGSLHSLQLSRQTVCQAQVRNPVPLLQPQPRFRKMSAAQEEDFVDYEEDEETAQEAKVEEKDTKK